MDLILVVSLIRAAIKLSLPLLVTSIGEIFSERSGVVNIGLEGMMLTGALGGMVGSYFTGSAWFGLMVGMAAGLVLAGVFTLVSIHVGADQIVAGAAINILALGLTGVIYREIFGVTGSALTVQTFEPLAIPGIAFVPFFGDIISGHTAPVYIGFMLVPTAAWMLYYTSLGLTIRSVGEHPGAADSAGIPVHLVRHCCILVSGLLAGGAGSYLSLAHANTFIEGMSSGRGFVALAIVIFGRWHPVGVMGAALLFGLANALQFQFQAVGYTIPYQFFLMMPYVLTLLALVIFANRSHPPKALAQVYERK
ncbi:MAG: ABC transporter permease [Gemmatimonadota bacterium]|nr:ABC transporter permease [Gemmatimonadota bacterium]